MESFIHSKQFTSVPLHVNSQPVVFNVNRNKVSSDTIINFNKTLLREILNKMFKSLKFFGRTANVAVAQSSRQTLMQQNMLLQQQIRHFALIRKYTKTHEWIEYDTDTKLAKMGISDHAQKELGDIVHVDLPDVGTDFSKDEAISCVESVKTAADIYQMVDGEVVEVNENVGEDGSLVNQDAEGDGWLMVIKVSDESQLDDLLTPDDYNDNYA